MGTIAGTLRHDLGGAELEEALYNDGHEVWLALDGEILNARPLRHTLELLGHRFRSGTGAEAVLRAYEQWGLDFLPHLHGAFALALWDQRRRRLMLARDRLGRKPLYVAQRGTDMAFGSHMGPLLQVLGLPRRLDAHALHEYLSLGLVAPPRTLAEGVSKLAPGEMLVAERGAPLRRQVWGGPEPDERRVAHLRRLPAGPHAGNLRTLFECAVADRLGHGAVPCVWLTPHPAAAALAAVSTRLTGQPSRAVAVAATEADQRLLRQLAAAAQAELTMGKVGAEDAGEELTRLAAALPEPPADSWVLAAWLAAKTAGDGALVLAQTGADEILLSHPDYRPLVRGWPWRWLRRRTAPPPVQDAAPPPPRWMAGDRLAELALADLRLRVAEAVAPAMDAAFAAHGAASRHPYMDESLASYALALPSRLRHGARRQLLAGLVPPLPAPPPLPLPVEQWLAGPLQERLNTLLARSPLGALPQAAQPRRDWRLLALLEWARHLGLEDFSAQAENRMLETRSPAPPGCDPR